MSKIIRPYTQGVTWINADKVYDTPICFSAHDRKTHLIDINGKQLHEWKYLGLPGDVMNPALAGGEKGHLLVQYEMFEPAVGVFGNKTVAEIDWDSNVLWKWGENAPGGAARQNHDWQVLENGNILMMNCLPRVIPELGEKEVGDQGILEVTRDGEVVWSWYPGDHLEELGLKGEGLAYIRGLTENNKQDIWGYLEMNTLQLVGPNHWFDEGHTEFNPENIIISSRKASFVAIIERATGKIVWEIGPFSYRDSFTHPDQRLYNRTLPRPLDQTSGQHKPHIIPKGLPGAGNLLVLDNNGGSGYPPIAMHTHAGSRVLEINPVTKEIVWDYTAEDSGEPVWSFFTSFIGCVQRLPNGNTLVNEGMHGRIFQITRDGELVWEYRNPFRGEYPAASGKGMISDPMIYRAQAVPREWLP